MERSYLYQARVNIPPPGNWRGGRLPNDFDCLSAGVGTIMLISGQCGAGH